MPDTKKLDELAEQADSIVGEILRLVEEFGKGDRQSATPVSPLTMRSLRVLAVEVAETVPEIHRAAAKSILAEIQGGRSGQSDCLTDLSGPAMRILRVLKAAGSEKAAAFLGDG